MILETVGHATLVLRDRAGAPLLFTDPWLLGSCYWRSWWLVNYPDEEVLRELASARYCYLTHEHPDHFHTPSLRRLGPGPTYLAPTLPEEHITGYLREQKFRARTLPARRWIDLAPGVSLMSIPMVTDDSVLLVDTPDALVVNLNDSKPGPLLVATLASLLDARARGKRRVLLSSYSSASIVNSFFRDGERLSVYPKPAFVAKVCDYARRLRADVYLPFASQAIFHREDSAWANEHRVTHADLQAHWSAPDTTLLPPYSRLDLRTGDVRSVPPASWRQDEAAIRARVAEQLRREAGEEIDDQDLARLRDKLRGALPLATRIFPRGIGFRIGARGLRYHPARDAFTPDPDEADFVMRLPAHPLKEALAFGHFGDLGITMFLDVELRGRTDPRLVYLFFVFVALHDYGHTRDLAGFWRWVRGNAAFLAGGLPA